MNLSRIAWFIEDKGLATTGIDLFVYTMPHEVEHGVLIIQQAPTRIEPYVHNLRRGSFQVIVRGLHVEEVRLRAYDIAEKLDIKGVRMGDMQFRHITPDGEPLVFPIPESRFVEASVNLNFTYVLTD